MIDVTVGTGFDYPEWSAAWAWIATQVASNPGEYFRATQKTDCTLAGSLTAIAFNGCTIELRVDPTLRHRGNPTAGLKTLITGSVGMNCQAQNTGTSNLIIDGLYIEHISGTGGTMLRAGGNMADGHVTVRNVMIKGNRSVGEIGLTAGNAESERVVVEKCKIWNCTKGIGWTVGSTTPGDHIRYNTMRNVVFYGCNTGINAIGDSTDTSWLIQNVSSVASDSDDWVLTTTYTIIENCAHSDGSIDSGAIKSQLVVPGAVYLSLDDASPDFLKPVPTGVLAIQGRGVDISEDIAGNSMPGSDAMWPIGPHDLPSVPVEQASMYTRILVHLLPRARAWRLP